MITAIVTTFVDAEPYLDTFISYHLSIGFNYIFLFFDDKNDKSISKYIGRQRIIVVINDDELQKKWQSCENYWIFGKFISYEYQARQSLNVQVAINMAIELSIDWILNIDVDELFYSPQQSVMEHFETLSFKGVDCLVYHNHEAIAEREDMKDFFKEVNLFKKNFNVLDAHQRDVIGSCTSVERPYFNYYSNCKSAARISKDLLGYGSHIFSFRKRWHHRVLPFFAKKITLQTSFYPCILHYVCCGFNFFWRKYQVLGDFKDKWFDQGESIKKIMPIHAASRDVCRQNDVSLARDFYRDVFIERPKRNLPIYEKENITFRVSLKFGQ